MVLTNTRGDRPNNESSPDSGTRAGRPALDRGTVEAMERSISELALTLPPSGQIRAPVPGVNV